jgi:hypothetical protein
MARSNERSVRQDTVGAIHELPLQSTIKLCNKINKLQQLVENCRGTACRALFCHCEAFCAEAIQKYREKNMIASPPEGGSQ